MTKLFFKQKAPLMMAVLALLAGFSGCGSPAQPGAPGDTSQETLLNADLSDLSTYKNAGAIQLDQNQAGIFTQIFGGTTGNDLTGYLNTRVHYYINKDEGVSISPSDFSVQGWTQETMPKAFSVADQDATVSALNVSIEYWIMGLINNVTVTFSFLDQTVPIVSSRTGIIVLADGYSDTIAVKDASGAENQVPLPSFYRQSILLHEARHSDCTGGLSQEQLGRIFQDQSAAEFTADDDAGHCGHLHVTCPSGDYQGLYACDDEAYGAYGVQNVFLTAADIQLGLDGESQDLADIMQIDAASRLLDNGSTNESPDMSSTDSITP